MISTFQGHFSSRKIQAIVQCIAVFILSLSFSLVADTLLPVSTVDLSFGLTDGGNGDSCSIITSADGRFVLFASTANNLLITTNNHPITATFPARFNVFLRDRTNTTTTLISANLSGISGGNEDSIPSDLSTNGQLVLFESSASDLVANDTNNFADIFVHDLSGGSNILVSVSTNGENANGASREAVMTPDGRYVAFVSDANNLVGDDLNGISDIFIRDLQTGVTTLASPDAMASSSSSSSQEPEISVDGRYVIFYSTATNLVPNVGATNDIYVRDVIAGTTSLASVNAHAILYSVTGNSNAISSNHAISSDGKWIAYTARNPNQTNGLVLRYNVDTGFTDLANTNAIMATGTREDLRTLDMTADGRFIAFLANSKTNAGVGTVPSVVVWDGNNGTVTVASRDMANGVALGAFGSPAQFESPAIDSTGRYVSFVGNATNLTTNVFDYGLHVYVRDLQLNQTIMADADTNGIPSDLFSFAVPRLSANGRYVTFSSFDSHQAAENPRRNYHVFLRDSLTNTVELISARHPALATSTPNGASPFSGWSINGNGRYVAFSSVASDLAANDTNFNRDVFVRDLLNQTTVLASAGTNGFSAAGMSFEPAISSDGRFVAFTSTATNLFLNDNNKAQDVFVCDLQTHAIVLASVAMNGTSVGNGSSAAPILSADGRYVFFTSKASNLAPGSFTSGSENLFWRDLLTSNTVALTTAGLTNLAVSSNGRYAAFKTSSAINTLYIWDSLAGARIYTNTGFPGIVASISPDGNRWAYTMLGQLQIMGRNPTTNWTIGALPSTSRAGIKFSGDGQFLVFASSSNQGFSDTNGTFDVYLYELSSKTKILVSKANGSTSAANRASDYPGVSYDGRFVAYRSAASDIVTNDANGLPDVFVYDRFTGTNVYDRFADANTLLSQSWSGDSSGNNRSLPPAFSGDGKMLVFPSWATDLIADDFNHNSDLFSFAFLYVTITRNAGEPPVISWPASSGQNYQVQFKNNVDDLNWQSVNGTVVITNAQASIQDLSPDAEHRIYRVVAF